MESETLKNKSKTEVEYCLSPYSKLYIFSQTIKIYFNNNNNLNMFFSYSFKYLHSMIDKYAIHNLDISKRISMASKAFFHYLKRCLEID